MLCEYGVSTWPVGRTTTVTARRPTTIQVYNQTTTTTPPQSNTRNNNYAIPVCISIDRVARSRLMFNNYQTDKIVHPEMFFQTKKHVMFMVYSFIVIGLWSGRDVYRSRHFWFSKKKNEKIHKGTAKHTVSNDRSTDVEWSLFYYYRLGQCAVKVQTA